MKAENQKNTSQSVESVKIYPPLLGIAPHQVIPDLPSKARRGNEVISALENLKKAMSTHESKVIFNPVDGDTYFLTAHIPNLNKDLVFFRNFTDEGVLDKEIEKKMLRYFYETVGILNEDDLRIISEYRKRSSTPQLRPQPSAPIVSKRREPRRKMAKNPVEEIKQGDFSNTPSKVATSEVYHEQEGNNPLITKSGYQTNKEEEALGSNSSTLNLAPVFYKLIQKGFFPSNKQILYHDQLPLSESLDLDIFAKEFNLTVREALDDGKSKAVMYIAITELVEHFPKETIINSWSEIANLGKEYLAQINRDKDPLIPKLTYLEDTKSIVLVGLLPTNEDAEYIEIMINLVIWSFTSLQSMLKSQNI